MNLSDRERIDWLRLARTATVGPVAFANLVNRYGSAGRALEMLPHLTQRAGGTPAMIPTVDQARVELEAGVNMGARLICSSESDFPYLLANIDPPPPLLWALGETSLLARPSVAIVGARVASAAGQRFARGLAADLGRAHLVVTSGMARGVDAAAHEGALPSGTVAVLGGGIGDIYPPENAGLYERLAVQGCILSESAPGRRAQAKDFPRRNRIISGLSRAVVVVEAELRSGSLITARMANEQGREVLAVPGSPLDPRSKGTNDLIRQGAAICEGVDDVLRVLETLPGLGEPGPPPYLEASPEDVDRALLDRVAGLLSPTPVSRDELARACAAPAPLVFAALVELSLAGRAELLPGGMVTSA